MAAFAGLTALRAAAAVDADRTRIKVSWIDARAPVAQVIQREPLWNRADEQFVGDPVCKQHGAAAARSDLPVAAPLI
jgi:hypothetical protein